MNLQEGVHNGKNVIMKKGETIIKCSEDHIEHFQNNGFIFIWMKNQLLKN